MRPFRPVPPGELLQEELEARDWTQTDLAAILHRPVQAVNEIIAGKKAITPETAVALASAFKTSPEYWLNLEAAYRLDLLHEREETLTEISRRSQLYSLVPVQELLKRRWINVPNPNDTNFLEEQVCKFLEISSPSQSPEVAFAARKTKENEPTTGGQLAWVLQAKKLARCMDVPIYDKEALRQICPGLARLSRRDAEIIKIPEQLLSIGVILVIVDALPRTQIDGASFWQGDNPVIALSLRFDRIDWFWFTLLHELVHICEGHAKTRILLEESLVGKDAVVTSEKSPEEQQADQIAGEWLLPEKRLKQFVAESRSIYSRKAITKFAEVIGVDPGIVVGRLQKLDEVPYSHHRNLLRPVRHLFARWQLDQMRKLDRKSESEVYPSG